jgi:glycosyltransferase involved in cell wall biosynthesis
MRIAILGHTNAPWTPYYARSFQQKGHVVKVGSFASDPIEGVDCEWLGRSNSRVDDNPLSYLFGVRRARRMLERFHPDVVFAPYLSSNGLAAALSWKGPLVLCAVGGDVLQQGERSDPGAFVQKQVVRFVSRRAAAIQAVSEELSEAMVALGVPAERISCFPVGVDVEVFRRSPPEDPSAREKTLICTRKYDHVYENHVVLEALGILRDAGRDVRAVLLGDGPLLEPRKEQARRLCLGNRVDFLGNVPHERLAGHLSQARVYVSASSSDGTSASLMEAMAVGCFPVVSRIRANEAWIEHGRNGLLFELGDARDLARQVERALGDSALVEEAATLNRERVQADADMRTNMDRLEQMLIDVTR